MKVLIGIYILFTSGLIFGQSDIDTLLKEYNNRTVPYISVEKLQKQPNHYLILDTRKKQEYEVSHIPGAIWIDEKVDSVAFAKAYPEKNQPITVYCSVGVRSEDFGESLQKLGYTNVKNLYGSLFAWKDAGYEVVNHKQQVTDSVHVFSKTWAKYLKTGIKVTTTLQR